MAWHGMAGRGGDLYIFNIPAIEMYCHSRNVRGEKNKKH